MAFKIGGTLGKIGNSAKKTISKEVENLKKIAKDPIKGSIGVVGSKIDDVSKRVTGSKVPTVAEIGKKLSIETLSGKKKDEIDKEKQASTEAQKAAEEAARTAAQARVDAGGGLSDFLNTNDKYLAQYGSGADTVKAILADTTTNAYKPLVGQLSGMVNGANVDPAFRQYQMGLAQQLQQQAMGQGNSLAQLQLQQATDRSLNQSLGQIRAATGANAGLSARTAALAGAQQLGAAGNASGQLRLQEQQQAQAMLGQVAGQGRSADQDVRNGQLTAAGQLRGAIGDQISGTTQVLQGALGLDASGIEAKRVEAQKARDAERKLSEQAGGAVLSGLSTFIGGLGS